METTKKIDEMKGRTFRYKDDNSVHRILSYKIDGEEITIVTDQQWFQMNYFEAFEFLTKFTPSDPIIKSGTSDIALINVEQNKMVSQISGTLMDTLKKVQTDPGYVNQAKQITNTVNSMINLAKLQIKLQEMQ